MENKIKGCGMQDVLGSPTCGNDNWFCTDCEIIHLFSDKKYIPIKYGEGDKEFWKGVEIARQVYGKRVKELLDIKENKNGE